MRAALLIFSIFSCLLAGAAGAQERLQRYHVDVEVQSSGDLIVTETIEAVARGEQIRRGVFRDFPTRYKTDNGFNRYAAFEVISVTRDGEPEPYRLEKQADYTRLYVGDADYLLPDGTYRYQIKFRTDNQIGSFERHDELYFNLIGTGWSFPIENASGQVILPAEAQITEAAAYLGEAGSRDRAGETAVRGNLAWFEAPRPLAPHEAFTVVVTWQKGVVAPAGSWLLWDNLGTFLGALGLIGLIVYYYRLWGNVGRDPAPGLVIPLFAPPHGLSPLALGYIHERGFRGNMTGSRSFAIAVTSLATKGYLTIRQERGKAFTLVRNEKAGASLPPGEARLLSELFTDRGHREVTVGPAYDSRIRAAQQAMLSAVEREYADDYFRTNRGFWFSGVAIAAAICLLTALLNVPFGEAAMVAGLLTLFLSLGTAGFYFALRRLLLKRARGLSFRLVGRLFLALIISLGMMLPIGILLIAVVDVLTWPAAIVVLATIVTACLFFWLLEAPTVKGRKIMDEIEGYMLFLSTTEWDRMQAIGAPAQLDEETFEKHLPYSMALGVEKEWTRAFTESAAAAGRQPEDYQPRWYSGSGRFSSPGSFSSALSSGLASTVAAAASPPSSSSGSGGGGSAGGGGGGGGGGGW